MSLHRDPAVTYGAHPLEQWYVDLRSEWREYMHYLYLPVVMPGQRGIRLPPNLYFLQETVEHICQWDAIEPDDTENDLFVYVTARRGFASPGNPLNRPGWHADGFGTNDINWIWSDAWPTRFAVGHFGDIDDDHVRSAQQFEERVNTHAVEYARSVGEGVYVYSGQPTLLYRLTPDVVHSTPVIITPPGGTRSFFKVSISPSKYNLDGNSHNYEFDYNWRMWDRSEIRNDPAYAGGDSAPDQVA